MLLLTSCSQKQEIQSYKYDSNILLDGVVISIPQTKDGRVKFVFHTDKYGDFLLKSSSSFIDKIIPANELELEVKLYNIHEYANISSFNYSDYLDNKNISAVGFVDENVEPIDKGISLRHLPQRLRYNLYEYLNTQLSDSSLKPLVLALLIGDKNLPQDYQDIFQKTGTSHLMVISGLHIGLFALIGFVFFRLLWSLSPRLCSFIPAQYVAVAFSLFSALLYSLLAGFSVPTQRAVIMLFVYGVLWLLSMRVSIVRSLMLAFVIVLIIDYKSVYNIGTWLSFSAVASLVFIGTILSQYKSKFAKTVLAQVYLSILLIPITIYYFNGFSVVSIIANIVSIPFVSFVVVPLLFVSLVFSFIGIKLWFLAILSIQILLSYLDFLIGDFSFIEYSAHFSIISLFIVLFGLCLLFLPIAKSFRLLGLAMVLVLFQPVVNIADKYDSLRVNIFDSKDLMVMIQDDGVDTLYISSDGLANNYLLENVLTPYLHNQGVHKLDNIIVTGDTKYSLDMLESIVNIAGVTKCQLENSWKSGEHIYKPLGYKDSCALDIQTASQSILLIDTNKKNQQKIYSLYGRILKADIIISSQHLDENYLKNLQPKYFVYVDDNDIKKSELAKLEKHSIKTIDTNNNGAITIDISNAGDLTVKSLLKNY